MEPVFLSQVVSLLHFVAFTSLMSGCSNFVDVEKIKKQPSGRLIEGFFFLKRKSNVCKSTQTWRVCHDFFRFIFQKLK